MDGDRLHSGRLRNGVSIREWRWGIWFGGCGERAWRRAGQLAAVALCVFALAAPGSVSPGVAGAAPRPSQPPQPASGPGGSDYEFNGFTRRSGGAGSSAYTVTPRSTTSMRAPVVVVTHGYFEYSGYRMHKHHIEHLVRQGSIVVYPRWQNSMVTPCFGPLHIEKCVSSALAGIRGGIAQTQRSEDPVSPDLNRVSYFGYSFGGILTTNLVNRWRAYRLPKPRAVFLDEPHDGGLRGNSDPGLDKSLSGIPANTLLVCHNGGQGVTSEKGKKRSSCNAIFPRLGHIPRQNRNITRSYPDDHGRPALTAEHVRPSIEGRPNAYDFFVVWRNFDALRDAALTGKHREIALGNTPEHRYTGRWSDGTPVHPLRVSSEPFLD